LITLKPARKKAMWKRQTISPYGRRPWAMRIVGARLSCRYARTEMGTPPDGIIVCEIVARISSTSAGE
jgi:hypothetical protein